MNIPTWDYAMNLGIGSGGAATSVTPTTNIYYSLSVHGSLGNEYIQIDTTVSTTVTPISIYNSDTSQNYSLSVISGVGNETLQIT